MSTVHAIGNACIVVDDISAILCADNLGTGKPERPGVVVFLRSGARLEIELDGRSETAKEFDKLDEAMIAAARERSGR